MRIEEGREKPLHLKPEESCIDNGVHFRHDYTGKWQRETDPLTGRIRMGIREYQPEPGRFTATWT